MASWSSGVSLECRGLFAMAPVYQAESLGGIFARSGDCDPFADERALRDAAVVGELRELRDLGRREPDAVRAPAFGVGLRWPSATAFCFHGMHYTARGVNPVERLGGSALPGISATVRDYPLMSAEQPKSNPLPPLSTSEYEALRESIKRDGFLYPVIQSAGPAMMGEIVDGFNRLRIGQELGLEVPRTSRLFASEAEFRLAQIDANLQRRQLTVPQRVILGMAREPWEKRLAKQRQGVAGEQPGSVKRATSATAEAVGLKRDTYEHGKFVVEKAPAEIRKQFLAGGMSVDRAYRETRRAIGLDSQTVLASATAKRWGKLPAGTYGAIVITPPWRVGAKGYEPGRVMPAELASLDVHKLAAKDAIVVLVTPARWVREAIELVAGWGLRVATVVVRLHGRATSATDRAEFAIVGTTGKASLALAGENVIETDTQLYALLDAAVPDAEGIRLFGELHRAGWAAWAPTIK